jgi:hypothetical protein
MPRQVLDPAGDVDPWTFPTVHRLAAGLAEELGSGEFETYLQGMLRRIEITIASPGTPTCNGG